MSVHDLTASARGRQNAPLQIAVVGRGFSGLMSAIALLNTLGRPFELSLFDPSPAISGGQALAGACSTEILNSRARDLSVCDGEPKDFTRWLQANGPFRDAVSAAIPGFGQIFVPKAIFSDYVYQRFSEALAKRRDVSVRMADDVAIGLAREEDGRFRLSFEDGKALSCDDVILATGYGLKAQTVEIARALAADMQAAQSDETHVVVLGSGLRAVDQVMQLRDAGFAGRISILSRRGFLPQPHTRLAADSVFPTQPMPSKLRHILRFVREACQEAEENGWSWQAAMNGLRKRARSLWSSLPPSEKRQFNRHLRSLYDAHRNRLPADVHARLERELAGGQTVLRRGTALGLAQGGLTVRWAGEQGESHFAADRVIDSRCLAADLDVPVVAAALRDGLAVADELMLGLSVNPTGELLDARGRPLGLFAIGPLGLGSLPDIDLVPEIVTQTYAAAALIDQRSRPQLQAV